MESGVRRSRSGGARAAPRPPPVTSRRGEDGLPAAPGGLGGRQPEPAGGEGARRAHAERPPTRYDNLNVQTEVVSRSKRSTFLVTDEPDGQNAGDHREEGHRCAQLQDEYIADQEMVVVDGYIGDDPAFRTAARLYIEAANANIAGMQKQLYFDLDDADSSSPSSTVIYTPNLTVEGYPNDRVIAVDLERGVTRVCNSDYFGESKKGGLRMWNKLVYDRGGLPLHAGCKVIPTDAATRSA